MTSQLTYFSLNYTISKSQIANLTTNIIFPLKLKECILSSYIFANIRLMEANSRQGIGSFTFSSGSRQNTKSQSQVIHGKHNNTLILSSVFRYSAQARFWYVIAIKKLLLKRRLDPNLILCIRGQIIQGRNMELQFIRLRKLSKAGAHAYKLLVTETLAQLQYAFRDIINTIFVLAEAISSIRPINELLYVCSNAEKE